MLSKSLNANFLAPDARENFDTLMSEHHLGKHEKFFRVHFSNSPRVKRLLVYAMAKLPDEENRPDLDLATYFYVLSEIENLKQEVKEFATQVMMYCEAESGAPTWTLSTVRAEYEKIKPLLD